MSGPLARDEVRGKWVSQESLVHESPRVGGVAPPGRRLSPARTDPTRAAGARPAHQAHHAAARQHDQPILRWCTPAACQAVNRRPGCATSRSPPYQQGPSASWAASPWRESPPRAHAHASLFLARPSVGQRSAHALVLCSQGLRQPDPASGRHPFDAAGPAQPRGRPGRPGPCGSADRLGCADELHPQPGQPGLQGHHGRE